MSYIVNQSFLIGVFPNCLNADNVIPVYKNGDSAELANYYNIIRFQKSLNEPLAKGLCTF